MIEEAMIQLNINDFKDVDFIKKSTGEIVSAKDYIKDKASSSVKKYYKTLNKSDIALYIKEVLGGFYQLYYQSLPQDMNTAIKFRFLFLCTYINYKDSIIINQDGIPVKKSDFRTLMKLPKKQFYEFTHYLEAKKLISYTKDKNIRVNKRICNKGDARSHTLYSRIFENTIREIYDASKTREHKLLGLIFNLLPYMHLNNNALCSNPEEDDYSFIDYLSCKKISAILECSSRTFKNMCALRITKNKERAIICIKLSGNRYGYVINPRLAYKGSKFNAAKSLTDMFSMFK